MELRGQGPGVDSPVLAEGREDLGKGVRRFAVIVVNSRRRASPSNLPYPDPCPDLAAGWARMLLFCRPGWIAGRSGLKG